MAVHPFDFALQLSDDGPADEMLRELARSVLRHVGYGADTIGELVSLMRAERARAPRGAACRLRFVVHEGELQIAVTCAGREWHTSRPLP